MTATVQTPVVVVGGSLVGLSTALFLSHWSVPVVLLERHLASSVHPRAIGYTTRTVELLRSVGVADQLPRSAVFTGPPRRISIESLVGEWREEQTWTKGSSKNAAGANKGPRGSAQKQYSPVEGIGCAQDKVEPVLRKKAIELGADLRLGYKVTAWEQDEHGVTVLACNGDGQELKVLSRYLVACDGGRSPIRQQLGIGRSGVGHIRTLRSVLFRCTPLEEYFHRGYQQLQIEGREDNFEAFLTTYGDGRLALMRNVDGEAPADEATQKEWIRKAAGKEVADEDITIIASGQWDIGGHVADDFSSGRVFLAGDAAHALPPNRGGYGANTGIADAHNIAWKLASVLSGKSQPGLLNTYNAERRSVALRRHDQIFLRDDYAKYIQGSAWKPEDDRICDEVAMELGEPYQSEGIIGSTGQMLSPKVPDEWQGQPGTRAPHVSLEKSGTVISTLDLFGKEWILISEDGAWAEVATAATTTATTDCKFVRVGTDITETVPGTFATHFGISQNGAVLIRPDGFIAWKAQTAAAEDREAFEQAFISASFQRSHIN